MMPYRDFEHVFLPRTSFRWLLLSLAFIAAAVTPLVAAETTFFVAPNGNDAWSGRLAAPNANHTDGPFATIAKAQTEVRKLEKTQPITITLRGGMYHVDHPLDFTPEDSGTEAAPIGYVASAGEKPIVSGARIIAGWHKGQGELWVADVPEVKAGRWYFHQLFVNGQRRTRARTPNVGFLYTEGTLAPIDHAKWYEGGIEAKKGFRFRPGDIQRWTNCDDAFVVIYHSWTTSIHFIKELNPKEQIVRLAPDSTWPIGYWWEYNTRYHVENIPEALDQAGEWYLDRRAGTLSYWPLPGEDMTNAEVLAPVVARTLLTFQGDPAAQKFVQHLRFEGISFQHTDCVLTPDMPTDQQGATERKPLIAATGLRHVVFDRCEIAHAGENGIWLQSGSADVTFRHCDIHDLGGGAVYIGPETLRDTPEERVAHITLENCWLHDGSNLFRGSQGVWIGQSSYNTIAHNEISDFHHLGISIGHSWGYAPTSANHNVIAHNHVHHICNGYFSDGGGIYALGISPGTVIEHNLVHDVVPTPQMPVGGCGIYLDEGSSDIIVQNNIAYDVGAAAFTQHYGKGNLVRNNIFAFAGHDPICCARPEEHLSYTFEGNIVLCDKGQATSDHYSPLKAKTEFHHNLYWDISGKEPLFSGVTWEEWRKTGRDTDSRIADPQFVDPARRDFTLKPSSPALAMGFQPITTNEIGLIGEDDWVKAPSKIKRAPLPQLPPLPPPPPPRPYVDDFESTPVGKLPISLNYSPADRPDAMSVVEDTTHEGKHVLRLTKADHLQYGFQPHAFYSSDRYVPGRVRFACDLRNDAEHPCEFYVALRDYTSKKREYLDGPALLFKSDGTITTTGGKPLTTVPVGKWVHLAIELTSRPRSESVSEAPKGYRMVLTPEGGQPVTFDALPFADNDFMTFSWFGFSNAGKPGAAFFVDNLRLELRK